ncbi:MAG: PhnD/SsuA/transferrin family substrate-binding protein, partial [bacterium]
MRKIILTGTLLSVVVLAVAIYAAKSEYVFGVSIPRGYVAGKSATVWSNMMRTLFEIAKKETGIAVNNNIQFSWEQVMKDLDAGKVDISFLMSPDYILAAEAKAPIKIWLTYKVKGQKNFPTCIYVRGDSGFKKLSDMKGATIAMELIPKAAQNKKKKYGIVGYGSAMFERIFLRKMMEDEGIKETPDKFFGKVEIVDNVENCMSKVLKGEADAAIASQRLYVLLTQAAPQFKKLKSLKCICEVPYSAIVYRDDVDEALIKKMGDFILTVHERKDFEDFKMLSGVDQFLRLKYSEYAPMLSLLKEERE